nr:alpha/beta hydrolase [Cellulomonas humilata]
MHVHGFAISGTCLMPTARLLARRALNVVPDLPGYGKSENWTYTLRIPALANALPEILDELELEKVVLVGNSMGCPVILDVAHTAPDRVDRMVPISPAGRAQNQPLYRAAGQLAVDAVRENHGMARVAVPGYLRFGVVNAVTLFGEMTRRPDTTVALIEGAAHSVNFSHPGELAHVISSWLDGVDDDPDQPGLSRVLLVPRRS